MCRPKTTRRIEPEPDLIVLTRPLRDFLVSNPQPADLRLVVEVSDTTIAFDLTTKAGLYIDRLSLLASRGCTEGAWREP